LRSALHDEFGQYLFHDLRFDEQKPNFILNRDAFRQTRIMICEQNFGCGSSRENAVWAVYDYGFRAVVAPSFGDIFRANSLKNGLLPVIVDASVVAPLLASLQAAPGSSIEIDLSEQTLTDTNGVEHSFAIDAFSKHSLLNGIDELDYTLSQMDQIDAFERRHAAEQGWERPAHLS
jgi:3-isopropylmalate/(R)-2-methylmalate dehydratase small subunit